MIEILLHKIKCSFISIKVPVLFLLIFVQAVTFSQGINDTIQIRLHPGFFAGFSAEISNSHIIAEGIKSVAEMESGQTNSYSGTIEIGYFFSGGFGFTTGLGIKSLNNSLSLDTYSNSFMDTDSENESYERRVNGSGVIENLKISFLNIPFCLSLRIPGRSIFSMYIEGGINLSVPLNQQYNSSGIFTFSGYYPE
jgi:hypothetical protein